MATERKPGDDGGAAPRLSGVLETVLYFSEQERAEAFYSDVLGLRLLDKEPGRSLFYRAGSSVLLLFHPGATRSGGKLPAHGATGSIHVCFRAPPDVYESWKTHLRQNGVDILHEAEWPEARSFYFEDSEGNLLEIANADLWPR